MTATADPSVPVAAPPHADRTPREGIIGIAMFLAYAASFATPWNGVTVAGLRPGDLLLILSILLFLVADLGRRLPGLPGWVLQFAFVIVLVTVLHEIAPTATSYLQNRLEVDPTGQRIQGIETNLGVGLKFLVPVVGLPLMFGFAYLHDQRALFRSAYAFAAGTALSSLIGFADLLGVTALSRSITGLPAVGGRAPGLAVHPNFLATTCVLALPIVLWRMVEGRARARPLAMLLAIAIVVGLYASGSRGGAAVGAGGALLSFAIIPRYRRVLPAIAFVAAALVAALFVIRPTLGADLLKAVRLGSDDGSAAGSDYVRSNVSHQGFLDFKESPLDGVGLQVAAEAHNVYIQALASGGILLLFGYILFLLGGLVGSSSLFRTQPLAYPFFVAALSGALLSVVENALTDRLAYVPLALIAALSSSANGQTAEDLPTDVSTS